jgi:carboxyl-terminal processing protease
VLNQFAFDVADRERERLMAYGSPSSFAQRYQVTEGLLRQLGDLARKEGIEEHPGDVQRSRRQLATRIKAGIARNLWGNTGFYGIMLETDSVYLKALEQLGSGA